MSEIDDHIRAWLRRNTFHHEEFADLDALLRAKEEAGLTISLCIPTWNEAETIGREVRVFREDLMDKHPLLDEIVVVDSGSTDRTRDIARDCGADVYLASEILPQQGAHQGKGENLWKAIHQLRGDLICFVDGDIQNIHSRFASALIAPLLFRPDISYVKAFYDRPLVFSDEHWPSGGGRVTEILVRPLLSMFFPELTALIQPLSGEYAARRSLLEQLPFPTGYGVELSHLIDLYRMSGLDVLAQVDLESRVHRNQATPDLGPMAFGILRSFVKRVRERGETSALHRGELETLFRQFPLDGPRGEQSVQEIREEERPPMITLPEYRERRDRYGETVVSEIG